MEFIDVILLIIIGGFALFGLWFGFFHTLGSLLGTVLGIYLGSRFYEPFANWLMDITGWGENVSRFIMFAIAFILINRLVGFLFWIIDRMLNVLTRLPFINGLNRLFGGVLGALEGLITVGFLVFFHAQFPVSDRVAAALGSSHVADISLGVIAVLLPLLPDALRLLRAGVDAGVDRAVDIVEPLL